MPTKQTKRTGSNPTTETYDTFKGAFAHFNKVLFGGRLPECLITVQRHKGAFGYFSGERFGRVGEGGDIADEIAMNPMHFAERPIRQTLSTLAHEMAHLWQHHFGDPPRKCYHNKEWATKMKEIGLVPSSTGQPGGKETGQRCSHYIQDGGKFDAACAVWLKANPGTLYHDRADDEAGRKKAASKTKYTCPNCGLNAWGKPELHLVCGECQEVLLCEEPAGV